LVHRFTNEANVFIAHNTGGSENYYAVANLTHLFSDSPPKSLKNALTVTKKMGGSVEVSDSNHLGASIRQLLPHLHITNSGQSSAPSATESIPFVPAESICMRVERGGGGDGVDTISRCSLFFNQSLFDPTSMGALLSAWKHLLTGITDPTATIDRIPLLSQQQQLTMTASFNNTSVIFPNSAADCLHHIFETQADRFSASTTLQAPDHPAVVAPSFKRGGGEICTLPAVLKQAPNAHQHQTYC
jgi:hypothetical protein